MFGNSLKCCTKQIGSNGFDFTGHNLWFAISNVGIQRRHYAKQKETCCKEIPQQAGRTVETWPKPDMSSPQPWRCECPREPMPYNNDPYRIKVPEIMVPPLPPSGAKGSRFEEAGELLRKVCMNFDQSLFKTVEHNKSPVARSDQNNEQHVKNSSRPVVVFPKLGYHGRSKYKYAFHEPWRPLDRLSLIQQAEKDEKEYYKEIAIAEKADKQILDHGRPEHNLQFVP